MESMYFKLMGSNRYLVPNNDVCLWKNGKKKKKRQTVVPQ